MRTSATARFRAFALEDTPWAVRMVVDDLDLASGAKDLLQLKVVDGLGLTCTLEDDAE